jgi:LacI family transcriptional regulator
MWHSAIMSDDIDDVKTNDIQKGRPRRRRAAPAVDMRMVAERAGVSTATVSRAINNPKAVSPELRGRIAAIVEEIGYVPDASARALHFRRTRTIGAIVPTIDNAMFAQGLQALQSFLAARDYLLLLATNEYDLDVELRQARNLMSRGVDGLILRGNEHRDELHRLVAGQQLPCVHVGVYAPDGTQPSIGPDNIEAGRCATRHLTDLGHRRIGVIAASRLNNDRAAARVSGIAAALAEVGAPLAPELYLEVAYRIDDAREAARLLLARPEPPTALVCGNDVIAYGALIEAERMGLVVPRDLSVVGFDDLEWSRHVRPGLTTIHLPTDEIWRRAGEYLVQTLAGATPIPHRRIDFRLVVRDSTAPPRPI